MNFKNIKKRIKRWRQLKKLKKQLKLRSIAQVINYLLEKGGVSNGRKQN